MTNHPVDFARNKFPNSNTQVSALNTTVFGIPVSQTWADMMLWEHFLNEEQPRHVIELGTGRGGLSLFLALQCLSRGATFTTIDTYNWTPLAGPLYALANIRYIQGDAYETGRAVLAQRIAEGGKILLFCDNGNKPLEFQTFAPLLRAGDVIATHDWATEILPDDIVGLPVQMLNAEACERNASMTRWFKVVTP